MGNKPQLPPLQAAPRLRPMGDSIGSQPGGAGGAEGGGYFTSFLNFLRNLWHRFLRLIRLEAPPAHPPQGVRLGGVQHEEQFQYDLALAMSFQQPEHAIPIAAPYTVPNELLFSDAAKLLAATEKYCSDITASPPKRLDFSDIPSPTTLVQLFEALLLKYPGLGIGESHVDSAAKYLLCYYMPLFVRLGVDTLYIEGYPYQTYQKEFDQYFKSTTPVNQTPPALESRMLRIQGMQNGKPMYTERDVITSAKKAGIKRVICIDTTASQQIYPVYKDPKGKNGERVYGVARTGAMNFQAKCIYDYTIGKGKCLLWAGYAHTGRGGGVPSIVQLCGLPGIAVKDGKEMFMVVSENNMIDPSSHCAVMRGVTEIVSVVGVKGARPIQSDFEVTMPTPLKRAPAKKP
ncbi:MAG: hypothetical protein ACHQT8_06605 [Chlamydiales bacterium]